MVSRCAIRVTPVRWAEAGTWTRSWDADTAHSKLLLGLRGPRTDQGICMKVGSDVSH